MRKLASLLCVALWLAFATGPSPADAETVPEPEIGSDSAAEPEPGDQPSAHDRITRLQRALAADRAKLESLRGDIEREMANYESLTATYEKTGAELEKLQTELASGSAPERKLELEATIERKTKQNSQVRKQADILVETIKALREQTSTLELKIAADAEAYDRLTGVEPTVIAPAPAPRSAPAPQAGSATPAAANPLSPIGMIANATATATATGNGSESHAVMRETAEQLEARLEAERMERKANAAEREILDFLDRKRALEQQIEIERRLLDSNLKSVENLERARTSDAEELASAAERGETADQIAAKQQRIDRIDAFIASAREELERRRAGIVELEERLQDKEVDQVVVKDEAQKRREAAELARKRSVWLDSPLHPSNIKNWAIQRGPRILMVAVATVSLWFLTRFMARRLTGWMVRPGQRRRGGHKKRADTLALSFRSAANGAILVGGVLLMLEQAGINVATVLGGAAIFGVAIAFGAQNLMRDFFNGFMILLEDQYELNDLLTIGGTTGRVEHVNLRTTVLRDLAGRVHFIPNGEIKSVTNHTFEWSRAVIDICVGYSEDVDQVIDTMFEVATDMRSDVKFGSYITETPEMLGVDRVNDFGPVIRMMIKTQSDRMFVVRREALRRLIKRFGELGIRIQDPDRIALEKPRSTV